MKFTLEINLGNEAMRSIDEVEAALADTDFSLGNSGKIRDVNGNTVGFWKIT